MITSEIIVACSQCQLKAYFLLCTKKIGTPHEYSSILKVKTKTNREDYFNQLKFNDPETIPYFFDGVKKGIPMMLGANLKFRDMKVYADVLTKVEETPSTNENLYIPTLVIGKQKIGKEDKLHLAFISYIFSKLHHGESPTGYIVGDEKKIYKLKLVSFYKDINQILKTLRNWTSSRKPDAPPIILNKHCSHCQFQKDCEEKARKRDDLSLLGGISLKSIQKYQKKGIFTVSQLSHLFRPRKQRKRKNHKIPLLYRPELQALALCTKKIYIQKLLELPRHHIEIFLDIEGIPDQDFYYLIGIMVSKDEDQTYYCFWANSINEEQKI